MSLRRLVPGIAVLAVLLLSFFYGFLAARADLPPAGTLKRIAAAMREHDFFLISVLDRAGGSDRKGRQVAGARGHWGRATGGDDADPEGGVGDDEIERLRAIGYLGAEEEAPEGSGVVVHDRNRADDSLLLYTSGHAPMAAILDRDGNVLHAWRRSFEDAFPGVPAPLDQPSFHYFRKAWLYDDGSLLIIFEGKALLKLDKDSNILWAHRNGAHHDFHVSPNGEILVLTREAHVNPAWNEKRPVLEDYVSVLDAQGEELRRISLLEAVQRSPYAGLLDYAPPAGDILHTNTLEILDGRMESRSPLLRTGSAVVSFNRINVVGVVDLEKPELTWAIAGLTSRNHDPTFLENGNLLLFDNSGGTDGHSRVLEIDPFTQELVWSYDGDEENGFFSECCGTNHRLPNGNTLITETGAGRVIEVTPHREIVWEFLNPHRGGENGELIAYIPEMLPLPKDQPLDWLNRE
ncbi:MAG TPA: arylsulfotransferase family protein [bacterium]|nr:arylsulfotransferase family protein [bacterium]